MVIVVQPTTEPTVLSPSERQEFVYREFQRASVTPHWEVVTVLASYPCELEVLKRIIEKILAVAREQNRPLSLEIVRFVLQEEAKPKPVKPQDVLDAVAEHFQVEIPYLIGHDRHKEIALARHVAMVLVREFCGLSTTRIGILFGGHDHTIPIYAEKRIRNLCATDSIFRGKIDELRTKILKPR